MKTKPATATPRPTPKENLKIASIALPKSKLRRLQRALPAYPGMAVSPRPAATSSVAAVVTFTVTNFVALKDTTLGMPKATYSVSLADSSQRVTLVNSVLKVNNLGGGVLFQFIVKAASGLDHYVPIGITFNLSARRARTGADPDHNFPSTMYIHNGEILTFTDTYLQYMDEYDFILVIRNQTTRLLGILDPCILHEN